MNKSGIASGGVLNERALLISVFGSWAFIHEVHPDLPDGELRRLCRRRRIVALAELEHAVLVGQPEPDVPSRSPRELHVVAEAERERARNQFYENMREVSPGDVVFSFCDTRIKAIGVVTGGAQTGPKPDFGTAGANWSQEGWLFPSTTASWTTKFGRRITRLFCGHSCRRNTHRYNRAETGCSPSTWPNSRRLWLTR